MKRNLMIPPSREMPSVSRSIRGRRHVLGRALLFSFAVCLGLSCGAAEPGDSALPPPAASLRILQTLPEYSPRGHLSGVLRICTGSYGRGLVSNWEKGFRRYHPDLRFEFDFGKAGSGGIPSSLYDDRRMDLGLMGRELTPAECLEAYRNSGGDPVILATATGSFDVIDKTMPMVVIVGKDSPLGRLTLRQLDGIFGEQRDGGYEGQYWRRDRARGPEGNIRTWGQLGFTGEWQDRPIDVYGYDVLRDNFALYFASRALHGGDKWAPGLHEFAFSMTNGEMGIDGLSHKKGSAPIVDAVARDPYGIGYCTSRDLTPAVKAIALSESDDGPYFTPTREHVADRSYPLSRLIYWIFLHPAGKPLDPRIAEFLRYVLSRQGQTDVLNEHCYLPITAAVAGAELRKLD